MLLVCPSCASSYEVDEGKLGSSGRSVRCKRCATIWFASAKLEPGTVSQADNSAVARLAEAGGASDIAASPSENVTAITAAIERPPGEMGFGTSVAFNGVVSPTSLAVAEEHGDVTAVTGPDDPLFDDGVLYHDRPDEQIAPETKPSIHPLRRKREGADFPAKVSGRSPVPSILFFAASLVVALAMLGREPLMRLIPASAKVYAAMGLGGASTPLSIKVVTSEIGQQGEAEFLTVEGEIENRGRGESMVPTLMLAVRDRAGIDIYRWDIQSSKARLASGEKATFRARLAAPPAGSESVRVRFTDGKSDGFEAKPDAGQPVSGLSMRGKNIQG